MEDCINQLDYDRVEQVDLNGSGIALSLGTVKLLCVSFRCSFGSQVLNSPPHYKPYALHRV